MGALRTKVAVAIVIMLGVTLGVALSDDSSASTDGLSMDGPAVIDLTVNGGTTDVVCGRIDGAGTTVAVSVADRGDLGSASVTCDVTSGELILSVDTSRPVDTTICILASSSGNQAMMYIRVAVHSSAPTETVGFPSIPDVTVQPGERRVITLEADRDGCTFTLLDAPNWIHSEGSALVVDTTGMQSADWTVRVVATHDDYGSATMWLHVSSELGGGFTGPSCIVGEQGNGWQGEYRLSDSFDSCVIGIQDHGLPFTADRSGPTLSISGGATACSGYIDVTCSTGSMSHDVGRIWVDIAGLRITSIPDTEAFVGVAYEYQVRTSTSGSTVQCEMPSDCGLSFDPATGRITGVPVSEGSIDVKVTASKSGFADVTQRFTITVHDATRIVGPTVLDAEAGETVTGRYIVIGYQVRDVRIYDTGGLTRDELHFDADAGTLVVTSDRRIDTVVTLVAEATSGTAYLDVHVVVHSSKPDAFIDITSKPPSNPAADDRYVYDVTADVDGCTFALINNPDWLSIGGSTVSGVAVAGTYTFMVVASKTGYYTDVQIVTLDVGAPVQIVVSGPLTIEGNVFDTLERVYDISAPEGYTVGLSCPEGIRCGFDRDTGALEVYSSFAVDTTLTMVVTAGARTASVSIHVVISDPGREPLDVDFDPPLKAVEGRYYSYTVDVGTNGCRMYVYGADWIGSDGLTICGLPEAGTYTIHVLIYDPSSEHEPFYGEYTVEVSPAFVPVPGHPGGGGVEVGPVQSEDGGRGGEVAVVSAAIAVVLLIIVAMVLTGRRR